MPRATWRLSFAAAAVLLAAADTYVVVLVLTNIMTDVGIGIDQLQRATPIVSGFLLGYVVVLPLLGRLSDIHGRQPVFLGCLGLFAAGSLITATAHGLGSVVVGRTIQGLGGGGLVPVTLALVADMWPPGRRGLPLGMVGAVQELGSVLGPLYGSVVVTLTTWRAIFWINLPLAAVLGSAFVLAGPARRAATDARPGVRADWIGRALLVVGFAAGVLVLLEPGWLTDSVTYGQLYLPLIGHSSATTPLAFTAMGGLAAAVAWDLLAAPALGLRPAVDLRRLARAIGAIDWPGGVLVGGVLGCIILAFAAADPSTQVVASNAVVTLPAAVVLAVLFVGRELRTRDPLIEFRSLSSPAASGALLMNLAVGAALMAALVDVPIFARSTIAPDSQVSAAFELVRFLVAVPIGAVVGGLVCERLGYRTTAAVGMLLSAAMFVLMARWSDGAMAERGVILGLRTPVGGADVDLVLCGLGFGIVIAPVNAAILGAVRAALHGVASALVVVARSVGMLAGLSLLTAIGLRRFHAAESDIPSPLVLCPKTPQDCPVYDHLTVLAVLDELHAIFIGAAVCAVVAAVVGAATLRGGGARGGLRAALLLGAADE